MVALRTRSVTIRRARTNSRAVLESRPRVELQSQLRSTPQIELRTLLTHLSQEVIKLLVVRVSLILWKKLRQEKKKGGKINGTKRYVRNTLLFTSTYSSYSSISNRRILDVVETENSGIYIGNMVSILTPRNDFNTRLGCSCFGCKFQCLFNC